MDGYENENLSYVLLIEQAGVVFGIRFGEFTPDESADFPFHKDTEQEPSQ